MELTRNDNTLIMTTDMATVVFDGPTVRIGDYVIDFPGEYERGQVTVEAYPYEDEKLVFWLKVDGYSIGYCPDNTLPESCKEHFRDIKILIFPGLSTSKVFVESVEPQLAVPFGEARESIVRSFGREWTPQKKLKIKDSLFASDTTEFVCLD